MEDPVGPRHSPGSTGPLLLQSGAGKEPAAAVARCWILGVGAMGNSRSHERMVMNPWISMVNFITTETCSPEPHESCLLEGLQVSELL